VLLFCLSGFLFGIEPAPAKSEDEQRLDTIHYGTDTEIAALIQTLKSENSALLNEQLDAALVFVSENTRNQNILSGILSFFGDRDKKGLEDRAIRAIQDRDDEANATVLAAVEYLGKVKSQDAIPVLQGLLDSQETRFMNPAFKALGQAAGGDSAEGEDVAAYLLDFYNNRNPADENRREIVIALGETHSKEGIPLLVEIAVDGEERPVVRMSAIEALAKIGDASGLDAILQSLSSTDPNVRSTAVSCLGPFSGKQVDSAILESFRDSFFRTRIGAAKSAGERKLASAIPYLRYRAEKDDVPTVRDEAIKALGAINNPEAQSVLEALFIERKNSDRVRLLAAEMLIKNDPDTYAEQLVTELDEAKKKNQTPLYNGFIKVAGGAKSKKLEDLARRFLTSGGIIEKSTALDIAINNDLRSLADAIRPVTEEKNASIVRKAKATMDKLGLQ
jgi:HEAT repeat protein